MNLFPHEILSIGDDVHTDVRGSLEFGAYSILIKTGKDKQGDEHIYQPDRVVSFLTEVMS